MRTAVGCSLSAGLLALTGCTQQQPADSSPGERAQKTCLVTGLADSRGYPDRPLFMEYLASVPAGTMCDISNDRPGWFDVGRGLNSRPVLVSGGHGARLNWAIPDDSFWLGEMTDTRTGVKTGKRHLLTLGGAGDETRAAFICGCQLLGSGKRGSAFDPPQKNDYDYYDVTGSILPETRNGRGDSLIGICGFSTYTRCELIGATQPFDPTAWPGADAFEGFMAAGIASEQWPGVPVCLVRDDGSGHPQSIASLDAFASARPASAEWLVRYVDWGKSYPEPMSLAETLQIAHGKKRAVDRAPPSGSPADPALIQTTRDTLAKTRPDVSWAGPAAVGRVRVRNAAGEDTTGADTVVAIRPEKGGLALLDVRLGLVWYDAAGNVKFVGGGDASPLPPFLTVPVESMDRLYDRVAARLGCDPGAQRHVATGRSKAAPEPLAMVGCVLENATGQSYMVSGSFRVPSFK